MPIPYTAFTTGAVALLFVALAGYVSYLRVTREISLGEGQDHGLTRAVRAHANLAEFAPIFLLLLLALELRGAGDALLGSLAAVFLFARLAHALGLLRRATSMPRQLGAGLTYLLVTLASLWLLIGML